MDLKIRPFSIRASAFNLGRICPGSVTLGIQARDEGINHDTEYTAIGTAGHRWLELRIKHGEHTANGYFSDLAASTDISDLQIAVNEFWPWLVESEIIPTVKSRPDVTIKTETSVMFYVDDIPITGTLDLLEIKGDQAWVVDWKFYNNLSLLNPINEDLQLFAYGVGVAEKYPEVEDVTIHRTLIYQQTADTLVLDRNGWLQVAKNAVSEAAQYISENRNTYNVGAQCGHCFQRHICDAWKAQQKNIETHEIAPYEGGDFANEAEALRFLLAVPVIRQRLSDGLEAAQRLVIANGRDIADITSQQEWGTRQASRDVIVDGAGCLTELMRLTTQEGALSAAKTSKSAMDAVLKTAKVSPKDRKAFIERLRECGMIEKKVGAERWEWRKLK